MQFLLLALLITHWRTTVVSGLLMKMYFYPNAFKGENHVIKKVQHLMNIHHQVYRRVYSVHGTRVWKVRVIS